MNRMVKLGMVAAMGLVGAMVAGEASAREVAGWKVEGSGAGVQEGAKYKLFNLDQASRIAFADRWGANWGWKSGTGPNVVFKKKDGGGAIKCGDVFALMIDNRAMVYQKQDWGINLSDRTKLDKDEYYQWKFTGCTAGAPIPLNANVNLTNTVENDTLVGCKRAKGVNLCWSDDMKTVRGKNYRTADAPI